ncbi:MAG: nucleotidyltransferase domain-containing protein [Deltaproteobacteria bacterium]|nr:nucleotidyltransferase domain-containing protein [Deltaproteobacteria bacterium]
MVGILKTYFEERRDVAFAFLYGSHARGKATRRSDVDVAVYFVPRVRHPVEFESEEGYPAEDEIWGDLEKLLDREVELLVLNRAPADISASALRGVPVAIHDWGLYLDYMETVMDAAAEYEETIVREYNARNGVENRD